MKKDSQNCYFQKLSFIFYLIQYTFLINRTIFNCFFFPKPRVYQIRFDQNVFFLLVNLFFLLFIKPSQVQIHLIFSYQSETCGDRLIFNLFIIIFFLWGGGRLREGLGGSVDLEGRKQRVV